MRVARLLTPLLSSPLLLLAAVAGLQYLRHTEWNAAGERRFHTDG